MCIMCKDAKSLTVSPLLLICNSLIYPRLLYSLKILWGFTLIVNTAPDFDNLNFMKLENCSVYICLLLVSNGSPASGKRLRFIVLAGTLKINIAATGLLYFKVKKYALLNRKTFVESKFLNK